MDLDVFEQWGRGAGTFLAQVDWLQMLAALLVVIAVRAALGKGLELVGHRMERVAQRSSNRYDDLIADMLSATRPGMLTLFALLVGLNMLDFGARWDERLGQLWFIALALQAGLWGQRLIRGSLRLYGERHAPAGASTTLLSWALRTLLWSVLGLAVFSNLGIDITAFVASLGIGGIAVALAAQNILGDLFASLAIAVDKPFEVGDFIVVGNVSGTVQVIGLKTTRIRSLQGEQIVMSNTDLLKQTISNFRMLERRRIVFTFGVAYGTTPEQAEAIPGVVRKLIEAHPELRFDRAHFKALGTNSLDYEVVYIVEDPAYNLYMDLQQSINLGLLREFKAIGVEFAFPTRTVHIASAPPQAPAAAVS